WQQMLRRLAQRTSVLTVIQQELLLTRLVVARLPAQPPCQALSSGGGLGGPSGTQELADVFQAVRVGWEIEARVDHRKDVARFRPNAIDHCRLTGVCRLLHPVEEALLVPAVMIDDIVRESLDDLCAGLPDSLLLGRVVGPEGVARGTALFNRE